MTGLLQSTRLGAKIRVALFWLGVVVLLALAVDQVRRIGDFRIDDAYITFSFSKNLAAGNGPVYSHGLRVEGYSNFLWMLLVVPGYWLAPQGDIYVTARVLAFGFLLLTLYSAYRMARRGARPLAALIAPGALLLASDVMRATLSGLETVPYMAAITFGWWTYLRESPHRRRLSLFAFLPAALFRIDGFVPLLIVVGVEVLNALLERRFSFRALLRWAAPPCAIWVAYFAWRYAYYGLPLPTTYYAKELVNAQEPERALNQLWGFARDYGVLALAPLTVVPILRGPRRDAFALASAVGLYLGYTAMTGGDWMPFQRFILPILPLGAVLVAWGVERVSEELTGFPGWARALGLCGVGAVIASYGVHAHMGSVNTREEADKLGNATHVKKHTNQNLLGAADLLPYLVRSPGEKLVSDYAGVFAVFSNATVIDMWGLCNRDIALRGGISGINPIYGKTCIECYEELDPDYFHVNVPIVRSGSEFQNQSQVIHQIFQADAIDRVIDLRRNFVVGRVLETSTDRAIWFLERRRPGRSFDARSPRAGIRVDYPFLRASTH